VTQCQASMAKGDRIVVWGPVTLTSCAKVVAAGSKAPKVKSHSEFGMRSLHRRLRGVRSLDNALAWVPRHSDAIIAGRTVIGQHKPKVDHPPVERNGCRNVTLAPISRQVLRTEIGASLPALSIGRLR
jgi:hypothetical protein